MNQKPFIELVIERDDTPNHKIISDLGNWAKEHLVPETYSIRTYHNYNELCYMLFFDTEEDHNLFFLTFVTKENKRFISTK